MQFPARFPLLLIPTQTAVDTALLSRLPPFPGQLEEFEEWVRTRPDIRWPVADRDTPTDLAAIARAVRPWTDGGCDLRTLPHRAAGESAGAYVARLDVDIAFTFAVECGICHPGVRIPDRDIPWLILVDEVGQVLENDAIDRAVTDDGRFPDDAVAEAMERPLIAESVHRPRPYPGESLEEFALRLLAEADALDVLWLAESQIVERLALLAYVSNDR